MIAGSLRIIIIMVSISRIDSFNASSTLRGIKILDTDQIAGGNVGFRCLPVELYSILGNCGTGIDGERLLAGFVYEIGRCRGSRMMSPPMWLPTIALHFSAIKHSSIRCRNTVKLHNVAVPLRSPFSMHYFWAQIAS